jgi:quinolinate synthase
MRSLHVGNASLVEVPPGDRADLHPRRVPRARVSQTTKEVAPGGHCEVHERFTGPEIHERSAGTPGSGGAGAQVPPDVLDEADFVGSTCENEPVGRDRKPACVLLVTECSMSDNVAVVTQRRVRAAVQPSPHMKRITLDPARSRP